MTKDPKKPIVIEFTDVSDDKAPTTTATDAPKKRLDSRIKIALSVILIAILTLLVLIGFAKAPAKVAKATAPRPVAAKAKSKVVAPKKAHASKKCCKCVCK